MLMFLQFLCQVAKEYFPDVAVGYDDPRVKLFVGDGKLQILIARSYY